MPFDPEYASKDFVGPTDAAALLGMSVAELKRLRDQQRGPRFHTLARDHFMYAIADLHAWVAERQSAESTRKQPSDARRKARGRVPQQHDAQPAGASTSTTGASTYAFLNSLAERAREGSRTALRRPRQCRTHNAPAVEAGARGEG